MTDEIDWNTNLDAYLASVEAAEAHLKRLLGKHVLVTGPSAWAGVAGWSGMTGYVVRINAQHKRGGFTVSVDRDEQPHRFGGTIVDWWNVREIPARLDFLTNAFAKQEPLVEVWKNVPDVPEGADDPACVEMSALFTSWCASQGVTATTIDARFAHPWVDEHVWTEVKVDGETWNVDFTARQFHNLEHPPKPQHQDLPCPMVWVGPAHPVLGLPHHLVTPEPSPATAG